MTSLDPNSALEAPLRTLPPLESFSLTHILYDPTHPLSIPLTLLSLSPIFLFVSYFTLLIFTRRLIILALAAGQLSNEVLSWVLKRVLKGDRPFVGHGEVGTGYGMPSSHSQAAGFLVAWGIGYIITIASRQGRAQSSVKGDEFQTIKQVRNAIYVLGLVIWSLGVSYSRYHLHYHSPIQIVAGYFAGLMYGTAYFTTTEYIPLHSPQSILGRLRSGMENVWEGLGGVGGWKLGDADGGWGEGWIFENGPSDTGPRESGSSGVRRSSNKGKKRN